MHKLRDANNVTAINAQLAARFEDPEVCKQVLSYAYHDGNTRKEMAVPYSHLTMCISNMHRHARWVEFRIRNGQNLLIAHSDFVNCIDPLSDSFHSLDSGDLTREEVQHLHNLAMESKKALRLAFEIYWEDPEVLHALCKGWKRGPGYMKEHLEVFLHELIWEEHLSIQVISREIGDRNLHNLLVYTHPQAFNMWEDVVAPSATLEASLARLARYQEPAGVALQRMVKATRDDITAMMARLNTMILDPATDFVPSLSHVCIVQEDLRKIMTSIDSCLHKGAVWNAATFGCTREDLVTWRSRVNETKVDLDHKEAERRKAAESRVDINCKGKTADWPKIINQDTWPLFLQVWNLEKNNFHSDWHRVKHLQNALCPEDKQTFNLYTESDKIIAGLMQLYGSEADIVLARIKELRALKPPRADDYPHIQRNLHKMKVHLDYIEEQGESSRLEASVVHEIVNAALDHDNLKDYNKEFLEFRTKLKKETVGVISEVTESNFALYFDGDKLQTKRLTFLRNFIEVALEYQLIYHKGGQSW